ncbi:hypothetical protein L1987_62687 [Smallanthus sonchifolius]|uniref:Uncharacterized protein n=1 Tax=Smallanthus sonchifolius TaxID=185202 RepID=A0ACB9CB58_9ASTR|nr:hypothetical protein L1987_62687 [Smallanthus sonchifolius]
MSRLRSPSFFKILLDASAPHLPLPPDFISRHLDHKIPKAPMIRSATGGHSWRLKIKKIGDNYCFSDGWDSVVADIKLGFGDFLVFRFDDKSSFEMMVYSPNGCEKEIPTKIGNDSGTTYDDDVVVEDDEEDEIKVEVEDEEEDEIEIEVEDDDEEEEEEEEEEYVDEKDDGDDDDGEDDGDGDIDGDEGDPFFMTVISETHKSMLRLPPEFVLLAGIDGEGTLTMRNVDGKEWETKLMLEKSDRYCVSAGWADFWRCNDLCEGDECVFKFLKSEDTLLLARVKKKRRPAKQMQGNPSEVPAPEVGKEEQPQGNSGEVPAAEVGKKKRELPQGNSGEAPAAEVGKRKRGQPQGNSGEVSAAEVGKRKRGQPQGNSGEVSATEVGKRKRGQRQGNSGEFPATEVVQRKRGQRRGNSGEVPAAKVETRGRRQAARGRGGVVRVEERVEVVKRSRGRPANRRRGKPGRQK